MWLWAGLIAFGMVLVSLYTGPVVWVSLAGAALLTVVLTFVLPVVRAPRMDLSAELPGDQ